MPEPTLWGIGKAQWELINSFANWLSAIGTLAAVIVSLWLARRSAPKARLGVGLRIMIGPGVAKPYPEYVVFRLTNHGERPLRITQIGWRWGLLNKRYAIQLYEESMSSRLPIDLAHGQEAQWFFPTKTDEGPWSEYFIKGDMLPQYKLNCWTLRAQAFSSIGVTFEAKPEAPLLTTLIAAGKKLTEQPALHP